MEKEDHSVICSTDAGRSKDGSISLVISPHRSRRLEEKAKALNKCRLSLEDLLCSVDKRNEKFGYVVTNIGSLKSDYSPSKTFSDRHPRTYKKGCMTTAGSSDLLYDNCKSVFKDKEVLAIGNSRYPGDLHDRRYTNYNEKTLSSRVTRQANLKTESLATGEISKSHKNKEPAPRRLRRTRSCANLTELQSLDTNNSCNKSFMSSIFEDGSNKKDLGDKAHPVKIKTASNSSMVSLANQVEGQSSKGHSDRRLVTSSIFNSETTTVQEIAYYQDGVSKVIDEGNCLLSQHHEELSKNPSVFVSESANMFVNESKTESPQEPLLLREKNQSDGDDIIMIEERDIKSSPGTPFINPDKITLRSSKDCSLVMRDEENSAGMLMEKSLAKIKKQSKCSEEDKTGNSEQAINESECRKKYIVISSSKNCVKSSLYSGSVGRHVKLNKYGDAVIEVVKSDFPTQGSVLIQPKQKLENSSLQAALPYEIGSASVISVNDSICNKFSEEPLAAGAEKHKGGEVGRTLAGKLRVSKEGKESRIYTSNSVKEERPSPESPEVVCLGMVQRSKSNLATDSINTDKNSSMKNISNYPRNSAANTAVRNLFKEDQRSNNVSLFTSECKLAQKVDQKNNSIFDSENHSNKALEIINKSEIELKGNPHSFSKELKFSVSSETDKILTSGSKVISRIEIPSAPSGHGNAENLVFDVDEDLEKCEDDVLSRHQKGDYSCGFIGFNDTSQIIHSRVQPIVVLERLPSWIVKDKTIKLPHETSPLNETSQQIIDSRISEEELLNRKEELHLRRKYKSMSDLSTLIHYDLQKEKDFVVDRRRITRSFGEEIKIDYTAKLPDERDVKLKKAENDEHLPFFGFNIPFGFLGLPDHYLVYRSIINKSKQLGFQVDLNLGTGNLVEKSESLYFMGDCNPFRSRPMIAQVEREKISPTKILEIASVNRNIHSQYSKSQQQGENLTVEFEEGPSVDHASNLSKKRIPQHTSSNQSYSPVEPSSLYLECDSNLIDLTEDDRNIRCTESEGSACGKDFCRLGCICESLEVREREKEHCGHEGCMFSSACCKNSSKSSSDRAKMSILEHIDVSSSEEELVRSKRKRKLPARLLQEEILCSPLNLGGKKQCSNISSLPEEKSRNITECRVVLNRFHLSGANVRCLYHYRQNCPCLRDKLLEKPQNVAFKSTSGRLQLNSQIIVGHAQVYQHGCYFRTLGTGPIHNFPKVPNLKISPHMSGMNQYRSTIIYPQAHSEVNESSSFSNGIIDSSDSLVMKEDLNRGGTLRYFFNNMTEFQHTLSQGRIKCSDLGKICSESLTYLPKGAVQIMKLKLLKEMIQKELAYLWIMCLPQGRAHVFLSKENKAPGVACQRVKNLDELSKLPSPVMALFGSAENDKDHLISCIQVSQSYFWQIAGTISFVKNNSNTMKTGTVVTKIADSKPLWSAGTQKKITKGPNPNSSISFGIGNIKVTSTSSDLKKLKVSSPTTSSSLVGPSQPFNLAKKSQLSMPSISSTSQHPIASYRILYDLDLNKPFDELRVKCNNFRITRSKLLQLFSLARSRKSFVKVSFSSSKFQSKKHAPGILFYPNEKNCSVKVGPFPLNKGSGVKTFKYVNGHLIETNSFLTISRIITRNKIQDQIEHRIPKCDKLDKWEISEDEKIINKARELNEVREVEMINPKVSDIVSTKDADPGLKIVIQDVQGHYDTFNDIPSPTSSAVPFEGASHAPETWTSDGTVSYVGEYYVNESEVPYEVTSDPSEPLSMSSYDSMCESNALIESVNTVTNESNHNHDSSKMHHAIDSEVIASKINSVSNHLKILSEPLLNHEELILKEEPNSDPLSEHDCEPSACSSEEILPDSVENSGQYDWSGVKGIREVSEKNSKYINSSPSSVPKTTSVKKKKTVLSELIKRRCSSLLKRSVLKKNISSPKARKLPQTPEDSIQTQGNIETGYLIPDVPGIQPIPVARGGMTELESKAITMKNPMSKDGKLLHILDLELANLFLNEAIRQRVNFFPSNTKINWSFVRVEGIASKENFDGLMNLGDLTSNMFVSPKGIFLYDEAVKSKSVLQRCGIGPESIRRFMEARRRRQIINVQKHLANVIGSKENTMISTIRFAHQEIKKLNAECGELENQIYHERCLRTTLLSRLRQVASEKERHAVMESLKSLKRETDSNPTQPIGEEAKDNWTLGDSNGISATSKFKGTSNRNKKRISTGKKDGNWVPKGSKKNKRMRKTEGNKELLSVKDKSNLKPQAKTAVSIKFQKQFKLLKNYIISSNNYRSKHLGFISQASKFSILENAKSVLAAADADTSNSPIENEESILSSGSEDVDIETLEDDFKVID